MLFLVNLERFALELWRFVCVQDCENESISWVSGTKGTVVESEVRGENIMVLYDTPGGQRRRAFFELKQNFFSKRKKIMPPTIHDIQAMKALRDMISSRSRSNLELANKILRVISEIESPKESDPVIQLLLDIVMDLCYVPRDGFINNQETLQVIKIERRCCPHKTPFVRAELRSLILDLLNDYESVTQEENTNSIVNILSSVWKEFGNMYAATIPGEVQGFID